MTTESGCPRERRFGSARMLIPALALFTLLLAAHISVAQEVIDPRSGRLFLTTTDLVTPAGPISLEITRSLDPQRSDRGLLGTRWRLNWESRLFRYGELVVIEEGAGPIPFTRQGGKPEYVSSFGDRVVFEPDGRAVRTRLDESRDSFDAQGRLVERDLRDGDRVALRYGADGRLTRIDGPRGSFVRLATDPGGRVVRIETSVGKSVRYNYVGDDLVEVQVDAGPPVRYAYGAGGQLTRIEQPHTGTVELSYDAKGRVVGRRWADGAQERHEYDDAANTVRQIDPAGAVTAIRWSQDKQQAEITDALGHRSTIVWDAAGRLVSVTGATGATVRNRYDTLGRTVAVENPAGQSTRFEYVGDTSRLRTTIWPDGTRQMVEYDSRGNLTAVKVGSETVAGFTYDSDGRMATAKGAGYPETRLAYHPDGRLKSITNGLGEARQFEYDARGNLVRETNPLGGVTLRGFDAADRLISLTDPTGRVTRYAYDAGGRLSQVTNPAGTIRYDYDSRGRLVAETNAAGLTTRYAYDSVGRLVKTTWPDGRTESTRYDAAGHPVESIDGLGRATAFEHDPLGRLARERRLTGLEIRYSFDALGRLAGVEDSGGSKVQMQRDSFGRIEALSDALGATSRYRYDALGNMLALIDARGQSRSFTYGAGGILTGVREASGDAARYEYDGAGRMVAVRHPGGGTTRFAYDALGNVVTVTDPLGGRCGSTYDLAGRLVGTTDAGGRVTQRVFEPSGRLAEVRFPDGKRVTHKYDGSGRLLEADDGAFPVRRTYDRVGRLVRVEYPAIKKSVAYEYNAQGLRTKLTDPDRREIRYEYNAIKQLAAVVLADGKRIVLGYDAQGRLQSVAYPNGITGRWEYDAAGRTTKIAYLDPGGRTVAGWTHRYDAAGNLVEREDSGGQTGRFQYDASGQLIEESGAGGATRYRYLAGGNRAAVDAAGGTIRYRHDAADRVVEAGGERLSWDGDGNLIARRGPAGTTAYEYDAAGRLVKVIAPDGEQTAFGYAPTGERVWKRDRDGLSYFLHDGLDLIQEIGGEGQSVATYIHGAGIDRPLAMLRDGRYYFFHVDRLGSIALVTDQRGQTAAAYEYDAFGRITVHQGALRQPFAFTGREWDASAGLYYYRARYYDPVLGRFLSLDPLPPKIGDPLTLNPYLYVRNNPLRFVDPLGAGWLDEGLAPSFGGLPEPTALSPQNSLVTHIRTPEDFFHHVYGNDWFFNPENPGFVPPRDGDPLGWMRTLRAMGDVSPQNKPLYDEISRQLANRLPPRPAPDLRVSNPPPGEGGWPLANPHPQPDVGVTRGGRLAGSETVGGPRPPLSETMPAPQSPVAEPAPTPAAAGGKPIGVGPGSINLASLALSAAAAGISLNACMEGTGKSASECAKEMAKGLITKENLLLTGGLIALTPLAPFVAAGLGAALAGGGIIAAIEQQANVPAAQAETARQAWQQANRAKFDGLYADLAGQIAAELGPPRQAAFDARAESREQARAARAAADQARELLGALRGLGDALQKVAGDCGVVAAMLRGQVVAAAAEAKNAQTAILEKIAAAEGKAGACATKEDADEIGRLQGEIQGLAAKGSAAAARASDGWVQLQGILERAEVARESLAAVERNAAEIDRQAEVAKTSADASRAAAALADERAAELEQKKPVLLARISALQSAFDFPEAAGRFQALIGHVTSLASLPGEDTGSVWTGALDDAARAAGYAGEAQALLTAMRGLPLCQGITSPDDAVNEAPSTGAFANAGGDLLGKMQACLAKLTPPPVLRVLAVSCSPQEAEIGQLVSCTATGVYSNDPSTVDLSGGPTVWETGPQFVAVAPQPSYLVKASRDGLTATTTVKLKAYNPATDPLATGGFGAGPVNIPGLTGLGGTLPGGPGGGGQAPGSQAGGPQSGTYTGNVPGQQPGAPPGSAGAQPLPGSLPSGYPCGVVPYPPCPPGVEAGGSGVQIPFQGLLPPRGGMTGGGHGGGSSGGTGAGPAPGAGTSHPSPTGGPTCGPATHCTCAGGGSGHIPCDPTKGACHCGGG